MERFSSIHVVLVALPTLPCDSSSNLAWYAAFVIFLSENTWSGVSMMRTIVVCGEVNAGSMAALLWIGRRRVAAFACEARREWGV